MDSLFAYGYSPPSLGSGILMLITVAMTGFKYHLGFVVYYSMWFFVFLLLYLFGGFFLLLFLVFWRFSSFLSFVIVQLLLQFCLSTVVANFSTLSLS